VASAAATAPPQTPATASHLPNSVANDPPLRVRVNVREVGWSCFQVGSRRGSTDSTGCMGRENEWHAAWAEKTRGIDYAAGAFVLCDEDFTACYEAYILMIVRMILIMMTKSMMMNVIAVAGCLFWTSLFANLQQIVWHFYHCRLMQMLTWVAVHLRICMTIVGDNTSISDADIRLPSVRHRL
jgi:hypothetical protein